MWLQWLWKLNTQLNDKSSKKMSKSDGNWENKMWQTQKTLIFWKIWLTDFCNFLIQQPFYYRTIPWTVFFILVLFLRCFCLQSFLSQSAAPVYCVVKLRMFSKFACVLCICMFCQSAVVWALESQHQIKGQHVAKHILKAPFTCPQVEVRYVYMFSGCYQGKNIKISRRNNLSECPHKCWMCSISPWETSSVCVRRLWLPYCCKNTSRKREGRGVEWRKERE